VTIWDPKTQQITLENLLGNSNISTIVDAADLQCITSFVHVVDSQHHFIFYAKTLNDQKR